MPVLSVISTNKYRIATFIALLFHATGLAGMLWGNTALFAGFTGMNMLLMFVLLLVTHGADHWSFYVFMIVCMVGGYTAEYIGVHTGILFGNYKYGDILGIKYGEVPLLISVNWFIVLYCCGVAMFTLISRMKHKIMPAQRSGYAKWSVASLIIDGAILATFFDWVMEPVAIQLGFWQWIPADSIPVLNFITWFVVSAILLIVFSICPFRKTNRFAIHLLLIEVMFFLLLRSFL